MKTVYSALFFLLIINVSGQNTISPYSIFGPGEIQKKGFGSTQNLGGAGIAFYSNNSLNNANPSSYANIDNQMIHFETGFESKLYGLNSNSNSYSGLTGNISYLALGFKYTSWFGGSIGIVPFSSIGYSVTKQNYIEGKNEKYTSYYTGSGGINQFYFSNAAKLFNNLSVGLNISYMFGPLVQDEKISETQYTPEIQITRQDFLRSFYFDYGMQYFIDLNQTKYSFGIVFSNKQKLKSNHIVTVYNDAYSVIRYERYDTDYLTIPLIAGAGIGINKADKYNLLLDYEFQKWSDASYPIEYDDFENSHSFSLGLGVRPWKYSVLNKLYKNLEYQFGVNYYTSYLKFGNHVLNGGSISFGTEIPLPSGISKISFGFELGINGTTQNQLIQEKYLIFRLGFSRSEIAFIKRKFD